MIVARKLTVVGVLIDVLSKWVLSAIQGKASIADCWNGSLIKPCIEDRSLKSVMPKGGNVARDSGGQGQIEERKADSAAMVKAF